MNNKYQFTIEGLENIKSKLKKLKEIDRPRVVELLKEARAQGDLSENAEYDAARDEQARIEQEINELEEIVKTAVIISGSGNADTKNVAKYITIKIKYKDKNKKDEKKTFLLVSSSFEVDPRENKISKDSPLGKHLVNASVNDSKTMMEGTIHEYKYTVEEISDKK